MGKVRVKVPAGTLVYLGGGVHPHTEGKEVAMDAAHAEQLGLVKPEPVPAVEREAPAT